MTYGPVVSPDMPKAIGPYSPQSVPAISCSSPGSRGSICPPAQSLPALSK